MTNQKKLLAASTTLIGAFAIAGSASALDLTNVSATNNGAGQYYGIADYRSGTVPAQETSAGTPPAVTAANTSAFTNEYGITDVTTGTANLPETSKGEMAIPAQNQLTDQAGIAGMKVAAHAEDAVMSVNGNVIGSIEKVESHDGYDTIYVRTSNKLDTTVSMFKLNVPKTAAMDGKVKLGWTVSELLTSLEKQVDMRS
ncbi:hypothetical protein [Thioclava pacifica]|uniref:PRC-barrel domain-containing protein n=1 Tax=Thioclava pacifica DSM 10166 TaxID=1353537 RepID=A0A074J5H7_9RHOB|nr:hypothetical protein [Thioclava pacifica]KEO52721.1 hypothetical protein TP2_07205 [Thioclava pacifica DSM 10166]